nr:hypothetical protein [Pandoravirus massiliensis]
MASTDPVWSNALSAYPRVRAALLDEETGEGARAPLFYRLGDLLRAAGVAPPSPFQSTGDSIDAYLIDLFGLYLDRPSWVARQLVKAVDARLLIGERRLPVVFDALDATTDCDGNPDLLYLLVVWPPVRGAQAPVARVSLYRVEREGDSKLGGGSEDDATGNLVVTDLIAQIAVSVDEDDEEYFDEEQFAADAETYRFAHGTLADLSGALASLAYALAVDTLAPETMATTMVGGSDGYPDAIAIQQNTRDNLTDDAAPDVNAEHYRHHHGYNDDDGDDDGGGDDGDGDDYGDDMGIGNRYAGTVEMRRAMVPLVALSPRLAQQVMAQPHSTNFEPSLAGAEAVLVRPCQLALVLGMIAATGAARRLGVVVNDRALRSLADLSIAAVASADVPLGTQFLTVLPEGVRERAAFATWQNVCSEEPDAVTGRLPRADRLVDVAGALGIGVSDAQLRYPERLCPDLLDAVVRAGAAAYYGAVPATPRLMPLGHPLYSLPTVSLMRHEWDNDATWSSDEQVDVDAWTFACRTSADARLTAGEVRALLQTAEDQDRIADEGPIYEALLPAVETAAAAAEAAGAPLVFEPTPRPGDVYSEFGEPGRETNGAQRPRLEAADVQSDTAARVLALAPLVSQAVRAGAILDPDDIVYPGRLCARMALYRVLNEEIY